MISQRITPEGYLVVWDGTDKTVSLIDGHYGHSSLHAVAGPSVQRTATERHTHYQPRSVSPAQARARMMSEPFRFKGSRS